MFGFSKCFLVRVIPILLIHSVQAQESSSIPQTDFGQYDCDLEREHNTRHVGQYIQGQYMEWLESYGLGENVRNVFCVTVLLPTTRGLSREEAESHYLASAGISTRERAQAVSFQARMGRIIENPVFVPEIPLGQVERQDMGPERERSSGLTDRDWVSLPDVPASPEEIELHSGSVMQGRLTETDRTGTSEQLYMPGLPQPAPEPVPVENDEKAQLQPQFDSLVRERPLVDDVDERERITNTTSFPWNVISILHVEFDDGTSGRCTGTLVSPYAILTAGHCLHARDKGGLVTGASAAPGQVQRIELGPVEQPYSERFARYAAVTERWKRISGGGKHLRSEYKFDYAALFFENGWDFTDTYMPVIFDNTRGENVTNSAGYPGTVQGVSGNLGMWRHSGPETTDSISFWRDFQVREFAIDASGGNSGGPFWIFHGGVNRELTGILSYGSSDEEITGGPWMGGDNEDTVRSWINWTPDDPPPPPGKAGTRMTLVFGSVSEAAQSFLRLYNAAASTGNVAVTLSQATSGEILGTWRSPRIQPNASRQFDIGDIEEEAGIDTEIAYAIAVESEFEGFVQHVIWNRPGVSLTNLTGCDTGLSNDTTTIINFHSSLLADGYESLLYFHNVGGEMAPAIIEIYDAATGERIGGLKWNEVPPDASYGLTSTRLDAALKEHFDHEPAEGQYHYNVRLTNDFPGYIQHVVLNSEAGLFTNMSTKCSLDEE